jgi:hypothetical protein
VNIDILCSLPTAQARRKPPMLIQTQAMEIQGIEMTALLIGAIDRNPAS